MKAYRGDFGETEYMSFLIKDDELSEKYNEIWGKVGKAIKKKIDSEPVYDEKCLEIKTKSYKGKIFTIIKYQKEDSQYICL